MAKQPRKKTDAPPKQSQAERDAMIDDHYRDRIVGGSDEGSAWTQAFGGGALQESEQPAPDDAPLTPEEKAAVRDLMIHAAEQGDNEGLELLKSLAEKPAELRKAMAGFDPSK